MSRYQRMFERLGRNEDGAFGAFLMLGDPGRSASADMLDLVVAAGADMIEVGIPFSDPIADGPVIQAAAKRALDIGVRVADCFGLIRAFRERHSEVPLGILTYANIVVAPGRREFFRRAREAGADSLLVADLPAFEAEDWTQEMREAGLEPVLIAAASTPDLTLRRIAALSAAYTYCVTRPGITGTHARAAFDPALIARLRQSGAPPAVFGFGISTPDCVRDAMGAGAAGVISGSAIVELAASGGDVAALVRSLKQATRERLVTAMI